MQASSLLLHALLSLPASTSLACERQVLPCTHLAAALPALCRAPHTWSSAVTHTICNQHTALCLLTHINRGSPSCCVSTMQSVPTVGQSCHCLLAVPPLQVPLPTLQCCAVTNAPCCQHAALQLLLQVLIGTHP